ncbi:MAG: DNA-directed RNA polymerase subunit M [Roseburia sp.]|nr:DNA-directed RNA polymerase subunit M [Roseburia sp.]
MKVYICPKCGWMRVVSRRKNVECFKCGEPQMAVTHLPYERVGQMSEKEREDYAKSWLYIHGRG